MRPRAALTRFATLAALAAPALAAAQPTSPFDTRVPPAEDAPSVAVPDERTLPAPADPALAEQVAESLVGRAQELYDARVFVEAKQLAVEALVTSPRGAAAEHAKYLIKRVNERLGITDAPPPAPAAPPPPRVVGAPPSAFVSEDDRGRTRAARIHGALAGGLLGGTLGVILTPDTPGAAGAPLGVLAGGLAALAAPSLAARAGWSEAQVRTVGMGSVWGGVVGGLLADAVDVDGTTSRGVMIGATVGATLGALAGTGLAASDRLRPGDVALIDTLAGAGVVGGLTLGMLMQPVEGEGYSVNAMIGALGGVAVGYVVAPGTRASPRRMARVAAYGAAGAALPFLLYALINDSTSNDDEQLTGALSTVGLVGGLYLGFRRTGDLDRDAGPSSAPPGDAPVALVGRSSTGRWAAGGLVIQPLSRALAPQAGMVVPVLGGAF